MEIPSEKLLQENKIEIEGLKDDPLQFLATILSLDLKKLVTFPCIIFSLTYIEGFNVASLFLVLEKTNFRQYITVLLLVQPGFVSSMVILQLYKGVKIVKSAFKYSWAIHCTGQETEKRILQNCRYIKAYAVVLLITSLITHLAAVLPIIGDEEYLNPTIYLINVKLPSCWWFLNIVYFGSLAVFSYTIVYPFLYLFYVLLHLNFQLDLLNTYVRNISDTVNHEPELLFDKDYQVTVYDSLKICIEQYANIIRLTKVYVNTCRLPLMFIPIGSLAAVGACYFVTKEISPRSNFRMALILILFCMLVVALCIFGQHFSNKNETFFQLVCDCPWLYWDIRNRRSMLLLLTVTCQPLKFAGYVTVELNHGLILTFQKCMYALMTLMY